jgi:hypothetical protein
LRGPGEMPQAEEEAAVAGGGSDRCLEGWAGAGVEVVLVVAPADILAEEDSGALVAGAAAEAAPPGVGEYVGGGDGG